MAHTTLAALSLLEFPQLPFSFDVERIGRRINQAVGRSLLTACSYESPESSYGACDGVPCDAVATVTEREYCLAHFREVSRG